MSRQIGFALACAVALMIGQANAQAPAGLDDTLTALKAQRAAGRLSWVEWAKRSNDAVRAAAPVSPSDEEVLALRLVLAERVQAKRISVAEFNYQLAKAIRESDDRQRAATTMAAPASAGPTTCVTNRVGMTTLTNCR